MSRFQRRPEWAKIMIRVAIITIIIMIGLAAGVLLSGSSKTVKKISHAGKSSGTTHYVTPSGAVGESGATAGGELTPLVAKGEQPQGTTPQGNTTAELNAAPYDLIPQHQQAYMEKLAKTPLPKSNDPQHEFQKSRNQQLNWEAPMPAATLVATRELTKNFLHTYESFSTKESLEEYEHRLSSLVTLQSLERISHRKDNHQPKAIGLESQGGTSGSQVCDPYNAAEEDYHVIAYSGNSAYVTTEMSVCYTGPSVVWKGAREQRTYALILEYIGGKWLVVRVASDTLAQLS